jgi:site-specific recombinase XerC
LGQLGARSPPKRILDICKGKDFVQVRDEAIIRVLYNTGARLSEVANLRLEDVDLALDSVRFHGKAAKDRRMRTSGSWPGETRVI